VNNLFPRRFIFHGNAVAAEVFLTRIGDDEQYRVQPVGGQSSLPVIGGFSESLIETPTIAGFIANVFTYGKVHTMAEGRVNDDVARTLVYASVADVRVTNEPSPGETAESRPITFTADNLALSMLSVHRLSEPQPVIQFVDDTPQFQGLTLDGLPIELELNVDLMRCSRWDDLEKNFRTNREFFDNCCESFAPLDAERPPSFGDKIPFVRGTYAQASFVRSIRWGNRVIRGHVLAQPGFGAIYFGEMLLNDHEWRVTAVRMQLGSNSGGQAVFAETDPNGTIWPPHPQGT
jgi:hypothetical protein